MVAMSSTILIWWILVLQSTIDLSTSYFVDKPRNLVNINDQNPYNMWNGQNMAAMMKQNRRSGSPLRRSDDKSSDGYYYYYAYPYGYAYPYYGYYPYYYYPYGYYVVG